MVSTCGPGLIAGLALSPLVAKAPLIASPQRKQSPSRGEIILLDRLRKRRMRYTSTQTKATSEKHKIKDSMVIKDDCHHKQHNNDIPCAVGDQLGPNSDASILAGQVIKRAKYRILRRTKRRQSQPVLSSPLQHSSSTISSSSVHRSPQAANDSKKSFYLPPITRSLSSSINTSPDTSSSQFNKSPYSPKCKRALFTNPHHSFLTTVALSKPCSKDSLSPLKPRKQHKSSLVQQHHRRYIYLSEPRSPLCSDGSPGAPPASPRLPDINDSSSVCYVLSLHDTKSQRTLKTRLAAMVNEYKEKQEQQLIREKIEQQRLQKGRIALRKAQQRAEIYALNKIMTKVADTDFTANDDNKV